MKIVAGISLFLLLCTFPASHAIAVILPCSLMDIGFSPVHPQPKDQIQFGVALNAINPSDSAGTPRLVLSQATLGSNVQIALDIVATTDKAPFPGYEVDAIGNGPVLSATGNLGSLPVGEYRVTATIRVYDAATGSLASPCPGSPTPVRTLNVYATSGIASVIEFYDAGLDHYFLTQDADEIQHLDTAVHPGWVRTGQSFLAYVPGQTGGQVPPVWRFYGLPSAGLDSHVYTMGATAETFNLLVGPLGAAWNLETNDAFELYYPSYTDGSCPTGTVPVYRLWNHRADNDHRYTTDPAVKAEMIARGYIAEGYGNDAVFFCALAGS